MSGRSLRVLPYVCAGAAALVVVAAPTTAAAATATPRLVWSDEFNGAAGTAPDARRWTFETGGAWGNNELQCYTTDRSNSRHDGRGNLLVQALYAADTECEDGVINDYTSARLNSRYQFTYGTVSMRAKLPTGHGIWPAFWAMGADLSDVGYSWAGEFDIIEAIGKAPTVTAVHIHGPEYALGVDYNFRSDLSRAYHVYAANWTSTQISFSVDGRKIWGVSRSAIPRGGEWVFNKPFYLLLNVAVGGDWPGPPDRTTRFPQTMAVDWIRVYK